MREALFGVIFGFTMFLTLFALPILLFKLICANVSIWRGLLTLFICYAVEYITFLASRMLMPLMRITPNSDQHIVINIFVFVPLYIFFSARIIKKFIPVSIGRASVLPVIFLICTILASLIATSMMLTLLRPF